MVITNKHPLHELQSAAPPLRAHKRFWHPTRGTIMPSSVSLSASIADEEARGRYRANSTCK
eukprot:8164104-Pyramimonas_sp.AAC.1